MTTAPFTSAKQGRLFDAIQANLGRIGYQDELLATDYGYSDWFLLNTPQRIVPVAAFGQTPPSYRTACFALFPIGGKSELLLLQEHRALGAPFAFVVHDDHASLWVVGRTKQTTRKRLDFDEDGVAGLFDTFADEWSPESVLRAKNVAFVRSPQQLELFDYELVPEIEEKINEKLDPRMRDACASAMDLYAETGKEPNPDQLFRLAFWILAGKALKDRGIENFQSLSIESDPDDVLWAVAEHYNEPLPKLLNHAARAIVHQKIWAGFDYRNLSFDVLTHIWCNTFVDDSIRKRLGIHPTPREVANYIVDLLPFEDILPEHRTVLEPCCGSGTFLLAAFQRLRDLLPDKSTSKARHTYLKRHLIGFEKEPFGIEITRLSLTLADFPNPNGWQLNGDDVFSSPAFEDALRVSRIVLCNPPFEDFNEAQRGIYDLSSVHKPDELLRRVLAHLHPRGILGFVLPRSFVDGDGYRDVRQALGERFAKIDVVALPDKAFKTSGLETALLLAHQPKLKDAEDSILTYSRVRDRDWHKFRTRFEPTYTVSEQRPPQEIRERAYIPQLDAVWKELAHLRTLGEIADIRRGLEWNEQLTEKRDGKRVETGWREILVKDKNEDGYRLGVPPQAKFFSFEKPSLKYLCMLPKYERQGTFNRPWDKPKVILNKSRKAREGWRIAAFADYNQLAFYETFRGVWPHDPSLTTCIAAVLNGPLASAFTSSVEGMVVITGQLLAKLPIPDFTDSDKEHIDSLVAEYLDVIDTDHVWTKPADHAANVLRKIDAVVLSAYGLSPRWEKRLLDSFNGKSRLVPFEFGDYFPPDFDSYFTLAEWLEGWPRQATVERFRSQPRDLPPHILEAITSTEDDDE